MSEKSLPDPARFTVLEEKFRHGAHVFRKGNTYELADYPEIDAADVRVFHDAGWIEVEDWPDPPARDPKRVVMKLDKQAVSLQQGGG